MRSSSGSCRNRCVLPAALCLAVSAAIAAQEPPIITGVVRDAEDNPVTGAHVMLVPRGSWPGATTDKDGKFRMVYNRGPWADADIPFHLVVRHPVRNLWAMVAIEESKLDMDIALSPGATLTGKVVDDDGAPVGGAHVSVVMQWPTWRFVPAAPQKTRADGVYRFLGMPADQSFSITAHAKGYRSARMRVSPEEFADSNKALEDLALSRASLTLAGVVVDVDGKPVPKALVRILGEGQPFLQLRTDDKGAFTAKGLVKGEVVVNASALVGEKSLTALSNLEAGDDDVRIVLEEFVAPPPDASARAPVRLAGKDLPELEKLGLKPDPKDLVGKQVLVCFWDMDERPSRRCVRMLGSRSEDLRSKDVLVYGVHARPADNQALAKWLQRFDIAFENSMLQKDAETTRASWGVQALPWLILTDTKHVVRKEGFELTELDSLLEELRTE